MQAIGNLVTIVGIVVTLVAYLGQNSGVRLADLEPGPVRRWNRGRGWVRQRLGLSKAQSINAVSSAQINANVGTPIVSVWSPIRPGDDIAVRADKLERNLDSLRASTEALRLQDQDRVRDTTDRLAEQLADLDQALAAYRRESSETTTWAMRWKVRGLLITLTGAGLSVLGS